MVRAARRAVAGSRPALCVVIFLADRDLRHRLDRASGDRLGGAGARSGSARSATRSSRCSTSTRTSSSSSTGSSSQIAIAGEAGAHGPDRDAQFDARACSPPRRRTSLIQLFFALLVIYLLPRRLDRDAQADDRQPRQLRRRADHRAGDPAGGRRDLDLYRHDHRHQRQPGRADRADPVAAGHGFAGHVGRHRRGRSTTSPISGRSPRRCCCSSAG